MSSQDALPLLQSEVGISLSIPLLLQLQDSPIVKETVAEEALGRFWVRRTEEQNFQCFTDKCRPPLLMDENIPETQKHIFPNLDLWEEHFKTNHPEFYKDLTIGSSSNCKRHQYRSAGDLSKISDAFQQRTAACGNQLVFLGHTGDVIADILVDNARNLFHKRYSELQKEAIAYISAHPEEFLREDRPAGNRETVDAYYHVFNKLFFFDKLRPPHCEWGPVCLHGSGNAGLAHSFPGDSADASNVPKGRIDIDFHVIKVYPRIFTANIVLHEMLHSFSHLYSCNLSSDEGCHCWMVDIQCNGLSGHGPAFLTAHSSMFYSFESLKVLPDYEKVSLRNDGAVALELKAKAVLNGIELTKAQVGEWDSEVEWLMGMSFDKLHAIDPSMNRFLIMVEYGALFERQFNLEKYGTTDPTLKAKLKMTWKSTIAKSHQCLADMGVSGCLGEQHEATMIEIPGRSKFWGLDTMGGRFYYMNAWLFNQY